MTTKRIIPCLDVRNGRVVKGKNFAGIRDVENPSELAKFYNDNGADELVFYDITASSENRGVFKDILLTVVNEISIPLTVGGGINELADFERVLELGADKVSINSGVIKNPNFVYEAAKHFGKNRIVFAMDVKRVNGEFKVFSHGGQNNTGINAVEWAKRGEDNGAGELVINSIDTDGVKGGFDLEILELIDKAVSIPIVASGGAGSIAHFVELFKKLPRVDAGLAASIFHFKEVSIRELKLELIRNDIKVKI